MGLKKAQTIFLYHILVRVCVCVCARGGGASRLRAAKCRAHKSHYRAHKKVIERNVRDNFCQNPDNSGVKVLEV